MIITSMDGQKTVKVGRAAKLLHGKERGKATQLELVIPYRRGRFVDVRQGSLELNVR